MLSLPSANLARMLSKGLLSSFLAHSGGSDLLKRQVTQARAVNDDILATEILDTVSEIL